MSNWEIKLAQDIEMTRAWRRMMSRHHRIRGLSLTSLIRKDPKFAYESSKLLGIEVKYGLS
jgi:hypothetical protein